MTVSSSSQHEGPASFDVAVVRIRDLGGSEPSPSRAAKSSYALAVSEGQVLPPPAKGIVTLSPDRRAFASPATGETAKALLRLQCSREKREANGFSLAFGRFWKKELLTGRLVVAILQTAMDR
jgi:hypothetical protein